MMDRRTGFQNTRWAEWPGQSGSMGALCLADDDPFYNGWSDALADKGYFTAGADDLIDRGAPRLVHGEMTVGWLASADRR